MFFFFIIRRQGLVRSICPSFLNLQSLTLFSLFWLSNKRQCCYTVCSSLRDFSLFAEVYSFPVLSSILQNANEQVCVNVERVRQLFHIMWAYLISSCTGGVQIHFVLNYTRKFSPWLANKFEKNILTPKQKRYEE